MDTRQDKLMYIGRVILGTVDNTIFMLNFKLGIPTNVKGCSDTLTFASAVLCGLIFWWRLLSIESSHKQICMYIFTLRPKIQFKLCSK